MNMLKNEKKSLPGYVTFKLDNLVPIRLIGYVKNETMNIYSSMTYNDTMIVILF